MGVSRRGHRLETAARYSVVEKGLCVSSVFWKGASGLPLFLPAFVGAV